MDSGEKVIIFGLGGRLEKLWAQGFLQGMDIIAFCDNDEKKQGMLFRGIGVLAPSQISACEYDAVYISSKQYEIDIRRQLTEECGVQDDRIKCFEVPDEKYNSEMGYWEDVFHRENGKFKNTHYKQLMLAIAQEEDDTFMADKVVADFGCGPRGSLVWTEQPSVKLGIDVLANQYLKRFGNELIHHNMIYVTSSETKIPVPNAFVDYLYTINSLDHVDSLEAMVYELLRILKRGGVFFGSFNLNEPCTECEPQTLTEEVIKEKLLKYFNVESYRLAYQGEKDIYENLKKNNLIHNLTDNRHAILWVKGIKL